MTTTNVTDRPNADAELREGHGEAPAALTFPTVSEAEPGRSVATWAVSEPVPSAARADGRAAPGRPVPSTSTRPFRPHDPMLVKAQGRPVAFDLETRGSNRLWTDEPGTHVKLGSFVVGVDNPRVTTGGPALQVGPDHTLLDILRVAGWLTGHGIINYDLPVLHVHHGAPTPWELIQSGIDLHDTQLAENLIDPPEARWKEGQAQKHYKLENVAQRRGFPIGKTLDLVEWARLHKREELKRNSDYSGDGFDLIPWDDDRRNVDLLTYARQDAALVRDLFRLQFKQRGPYMVREHRVAALAAQMTINGFAVDEVLLNRRIREAAKKRARILDELRGKYGLPTHTKDGKHEAKSPQSTKAGKEAILAAFVDAGLNPDTFPRTEKTNTPDLSKETMLTILEHGQNKRAVELAEAILDLNGIRSTYQQTQDNLHDGRVHPNISMRQASGRWSFSKPGLTVMGKIGQRVRDRDVFIAEPGHVMIAVDLAQIDARVVAVHAQDPGYIAMFAPGKDLHTWVAERLWRDASRRQDAKVLAHGWAYNMGIKTLMRHTGLSLDEAVEYDTFMRETFPGLVEWKKEVVARGEAGELLDSGFGRKLRVNPERAYTQAPALKGQSGARDAMMQGLLNVVTAIPESLGWLRGQIHDELVLSVPEADAPEIEQEVAKAMSFEWCPPHGKIPIQVVAEVGKGRGKRWSDCYGSV